LLSVLGISAPFLEKININNMSIATIENNKNEEEYVEINSLNNDIYINDIKYNFNFNFNFQENYNQINIEYLDVFNEDENIINSTANINLKNKTFSSTIKTSNYNILGIKPKKSIVNITSSDLEKYNVEFSLYKVSGLVEKTLDKMNGVFFIECKNRVCSDYVITFNENIKITDNHYKGEFEVDDIKKINDFNLQVKSTFIDIFKKDKLNRVK